MFKNQFVWYNAAWIVTIVLEEQAAFIFRVWIVQEDFSLHQRHCENVKSVIMFGFVCNIYHIEGQGLLKYDIVYCADRYWYFRWTYYIIFRDGGNMFLIYQTAQHHILGYSNLTALRTQNPCSVTGFYRKYKKIKL